MTVEEADRHRPRWERLDRFQRLSLLSIPTAFALVALVALWLQPDPRGVGTHQQLGFPPCTTQALFGIPCPFCGMTTSFSHMVRGNIAESFRCQPAGALMFLAGIVVAAGALGIAASGYRPSALSTLLQSKLFWGGSVALVALAWAYKIYRTTAGA